MSTEQVTLTGRGNYLDGQVVPWPAGIRHLSVPYVNEEHSECYPAALYRRTGPYTAVWIKDQIPCPSEAVK